MQRTEVGLILDWTHERPDDWITRNGVVYDPVAQRSVAMIAATMPAASMEHVLRCIAIEHAVQRERQTRVPPATLAADLAVLGLPRAADVGFCIDCGLAPPATLHCDTHAPRYHPYREYDPRDINTNGTTR